MSDREIIYEVKDLKRYFKAKGNKVVKAVDNVSFNIYKGETFSLVGESGCGKTTCGRTLLGIYPKTSGNILYKGQDMDKLEGESRRMFKKNNQMIFQDPYSCLDPRMSIGTIIQEGMRVHFKYNSNERDRIVAELLNKVGLPDEFASRFPHELSGGQRQRIGIARALALEPDFIACDEPIAALDVSIQAQVINLMIKLQKEMGLTYLFISHDLSMVKHISDRIGVMYLGSLVELSNTKDLYDNPLHPYTKALFSAIPKADPDADWAKTRIKLEGEVPNPINTPPGCKFCKRCKQATPICMEQQPQLKEIEPGHFVACHLI
jgi:oligopeptide transport system ATP-binding protein